VLGGFGFGIDQQFFVELFAGAQAGADDRSLAQMCFHPRESRATMKQADWAPTQSFQAGRSPATPDLA